ncbi:hypothetical protein B0H11DRAFT_1364940 [Mycena galericulata]|nr:hypothetical protein B0H11DRAFT_1364940 [Mycena galericulata]
MKESPENESMLYLPVFYANLDTDSIPHPNDVDTLSPSQTVVSVLMRAFISLQALESFPHLPPDIYTVFWPRAWAWISFLDTYDIHTHCLANARGSGARNANRVHYLQKIAHFRTHAREETAILINSTEGIWTMVAAVWTLCVERNLFAGGYAGVAVVCKFVASPISRAQLNETIDAMGGTQTALAAVVVQHMELVACNPQNPLTSGNLWTLESVLTFLLYCADNRKFLSPQVFAERGLAKALVESICSLSRISAPKWGELMSMCLHLFYWTVGSDGHLNVCMPLALKSGLLRAIVACGNCNSSVTDTCRVILTRDLSPSLAYYHVLRRLSKALRDVKFADMRKTAIFAEWTEFVELAKSRLKIFKFFNSDEFVSSRACENTKCDIIDHAGEFSVCSACRQRFYCSEDCQQIDWEAGGHRDACSVLSKAATETPEKLGKRELSFLRALVHHDYSSRKHDLWLRQISFMHLFPSMDFSLLFDYSKGALSIKIIPNQGPQSPHNPDAPDESQTTVALRSDGESTTKDPLDIDGPFRAAQAAASGGRMELHQVLIALGKDIVKRSVPMHSSSVALFDGLRRIVNGIENGLDISQSQAQQHFLAEIKKLEAEEGAGVIQIH